MDLILLISDDYEYIYYNVHNDDENIQADNCYNSD